MYHLLIEFGSYMQLARLKPGVVDRAVAHIEGLLAHARGRVISVSGGRRLYRFDEGDASDPQAVAERTAEAFEALHAYQEELAGYTFLLAYESGTPPSELLERLTNTILAATDDESLLIADSAYQSLGGFLQTEEQGRLHRFTGRRSSTTRGTGNIRDIAVHPRVAEAGVEALGEWLDGTGEAPLLAVRGGELDGARYTAEEIVARVQGERGAWLTIYGDTANRESIQVLATSLDTIGMSQTSRYLNGTERVVWEDKRPLMERLQRGAPPILHDSLESDFQRGFALYLTAYARRMATGGRSFFLLVPRYDLLNQTAVDLLDGVIASLSPSMRPVVVVTCDMRGEVRRLGELRRVELRLFELSADEFIERVDAALSEATKRLVRVREAHERTGGHLVSLHHYVVLLRERGKHEATPERLERAEITRTVLDKLSQTEREVLFVAGLWEGRAPSRRFMELVEWIGFDGSVVTEVLRRLARLGLISDSERCTHAFGWIDERMYNLLGQRAEQLGRSVATWCYREFEEGQLEADSTLAVLLGRYEEPERLASLYHRNLRLLLNRRDLDGARKVLQNPIPLSGSDDDSSPIREITTVARARYLLLQGEHEDANRLLRDRSAVSQALAPESALERARAFFAAGNLGEAHQYIKRSIILYQDRQDEAGIDRATTDFGVCVLAMDHVNDARNYLWNSRSSDSYEWMRGLLFRVVTLFLQGSYSRVKEGTAELVESAAAQGLREFELFALFVAARTHFELGQYDECSTGLSRFLTTARIYGVDDAFRLGALWLARCFAYQGNLEHARFLLDRYGGNAESLLFRAEAFEFEGRLHDALECARSGYEASYAPTDQNMERVSWATGLSNLEDLVIREEPVLSRLLWAYTGYLAARTGSVEEGVATLRELTRHRSIVESDPYNRVYYYLYSEVLASAEGATDDRSTVLGKSVRFVQDRASRIDSYYDKTAFLHSNYWNSRIVSVAKHYNLFA